MIDVVDTPADDSSFRGIGRQIDDPLTARSLHQGGKLGNYMTAQGRVDLFVKVRERGGEGGRR